MKIIKINAMWCSACISMHKIWRSLEAKYPDLEIVTYDYDLDEDNVSELQVGDILPVYIFYKDNTEITRLCGEKKQEELEKIILEEGSIK